MIMIYITDTVPAGHSAAGTQPSSKRANACAAACCGRFGSTVTAMPLAPTPRPGAEYCLWRRSGACVKRCPVGALGLGGGEATYDRYACNTHVFEDAAVYELGNGDTCGKCMVGMPCALRAPGNG